MSHSNYILLAGRLLFWGCSMGYLDKPLLKNKKGVALMLSWFDAKVAKEFGASMARIYIDCIPLSEKLSEKKLVAVTRQAVSKMARELNNFKQTNKLNTYKTAQMGNAFKWALKDAGYDDHQINKVTEWLVAAAK